MNIQHMLETMTMATLFDSAASADSPLASKSEKAPISGYLKPVENPDDSFKLIIWSEDTDRSEYHFFTTLDFSAVIRDDIDALLNNVTGIDGEIVCKADDCYRKDRDTLRSSLTRLQGILQKAVEDIDVQSASLEHDTGE